MDRFDNTIKDALTDILGTDNVTFSEDELLCYSYDATDINRPWHLRRDEIQAISLFQSAFRQVDIEDPGHWAGLEALL